MYYVIEGDPFIRSHSELAGRIVSRHRLATAADRAAARIDRGERDVAVVCVRRVYPVGYGLTWGEIHASRRRA